MNQNLITRLSVGAAILFLFTACGGDQHGSAGVPRPANINALWMSDNALQQWRSAGGNPQAFCRLVERSPALHGFDEPFNNEPASRILAIVPGGWVYRWYPGLAFVSAEMRNQSLVGRIDGAGASAFSGRGGLDIGRFRFTDPNHIVQENGEDLFIGANTRLRANTRPDRQQYREYQSRAVDGGRGFTRMTRDELNVYVNAVRACDQDRFPARPIPESRAGVEARRRAQGGADSTGPVTSPIRPDERADERSPNRPAAQGGALPPVWNDQGDVPPPAEDDSREGEPAAPAAPPAAKRTGKAATPPVEVDRGAEQSAPTQVVPGYIPRRNK